MVRNSFEHLRQSFVSINRFGEATTIVAVRFSAHFLDYQLREQNFKTYLQRKFDQTCSDFCSFFFSFL